MSANELARGVAIEFRRRMAGEYVPRIGRCLQLLDELLGNDAIWRRPAPNCNSVGNLVLHLTGNVRQWVQSGLRGDADGRDRDSEFAAEVECDLDKDALLQGLTATVSEACDVVDSLGTAALLEKHTFQSRFQETGLAAVLHVLEHFSGHAGQIYYWTKQVTGKDLAFYDL